MNVPASTDDVCCLISCTHSNVSKLHIRIVLSYDPVEVEREVEWKRKRKNEANKRERGEKERGKRQMKV